MNIKQQAILACDMIEMIRQYADDAEVLEYLESFAFSLARMTDGAVVVRWDDIAGVCDQRSHALKLGEELPLDLALLDKCERDARGIVAKED